MRLLQVFENGEFSLTDQLNDSIPPYAILSHTWGEDHQEVSFKDLTIGPRRAIFGYEKLRFCAEQATRDGLHHFWVDSCCIDKSNSVELQEAITCMFRWYQNATKCYVYLSDISTGNRKESDHSSQDTWEQSFQASRWFTRGWTLQELLAPASVEFFSRDGQRLGDKRSLEQQIHDRTGIAIPALRGVPLSAFSIDERMSWAKARQTKREEDKAYSLLGIFGVYMPLIYGEGVNAFNRLQKEVFGDLPLYRLPYAIEAPFNSYTKQNEPTCLLDTRVRLLQDIYDWANQEDERTIFWLNGFAGTGKSTTARSVARHFFDKKCLGASFFFSRGSGDVSHAGKFVTSIAMQLTASIPALRQYVNSAIAECSDIASRSLRDQWHKLVLGPLSKLNTTDCQHLYVLVVDALDECDDNNIQIILFLLTEVRLLAKVRIRVFLTSRPEIPIRYGFRQIPDEEHQDFVLHNISTSIIDHDITVFLKHHLNVIRRECSLDDDWPGEDIIRQLVQNACGLFIWAATACRFIRQGKRFATKRLHTILNSSGSYAIEPERHLDEIYTTVLANSVSSEYTDAEKKDICGQLRHILGSIVVVFSPLSVPSLQTLLHISERIDEMLEDLHSIIDIPKDETHALRLHHPSFRDFLLSKGRCQESSFWVDEKQAHNMLTNNCIRLLSSCLKEDICGVNAPGMLAASIESSVVEQYLPPEIQYACTYWIQHLQKSGSQLHDEGQVHTFLQEHLLHWIEALGWIGRVSEGIYAIIALESILSAYDCPRLSNFIHDARRFILSSKQTVEKTPLQIYQSAIVFAPMKSVIRVQFKNSIPGWIQQLPRVKNDWDALLQTLEGHLGPVTAVAFSRDGVLLASASADRTVRVWDARSGAVLQTLEGHPDPVIAVAFSPDGTLLASTSSQKIGENDKVVKLWNVWSGAVLQTLESRSDRVINALTFSSDGTLLAWGSTDSVVELWNTQSGVALQTLKGHSDHVNDLVLSPDGILLASASTDTTIKVWDARSGLALHTLEGHLERVSAVIFSPDGTFLASGSSDSTVKLWDAESGALLQTLNGHSGWVGSIACSPDGTLLASSSSLSPSDSSIRIWDIRSGDMLQVLMGHSRWINSIAFSPDGLLLASGSSDKTVKLWDFRSRAEPQKLQGHSRWVDCVTFSPDGMLLASASEDMTIKLWDTHSALVLRTLEGHSNWVSDIAFSPDGILLASGSADSTVKLWDAQSGALLHTLKGHSGWVGSIAFSPDGTMLASASWDKTIKLWDVKSRAVLRTLEGQSDWTSAYHDERLGRDVWLIFPRHTRVMDVGFRLGVAQPMPYTRCVLAIAFSPDGMLLASASWFKTLKVWDTRSGEALHTLEGHSDPVTAVTFSPDGALLASASTDGAVKVWNARSGAALETLELGIATNTLFFADDGTYLETRSGWSQSIFGSRDASVSLPTSSLFVKQRWVIYRAKNILYLPSEYTPSSIAVYRHKFAWGSPAGGVFIMEIDARNTP